MSPLLARAAGAPAPGFSHETFAYREDDEFAAVVAAFVREGLAHDEAVVVAEPPPRLEQLRAALGDDAAAVDFLDMTAIGGNPGRIISVWAAALDRHHRAGRTLRGVGEPAYPGRSPAELVECELHELLLNAAFDDGPAWRLLCPYDQGGLPAEVCERALGTHPYRTGADGVLPTGGPGGPTAAELLATSLPPPGEVVLRGEFGPADVPAVRRTVAQYARTSGLTAEQVEALALAASELATNSIRHGGGTGVLAMWNEPGATVVEFSDAGHLADPLIGRRLPDPPREGGHGVRLVHQLCDLVQVRSSPAGTTVRVTTWH
ncbi:sensor histidine kinase [Geodermatophilus sabuli]|uniref:Anti-sigma regulatory factor (Ser/Thr protein kinase) n=1 Tax=Geodermatophilus sabuli TaxID=1564158 RepID=A0A285ECS6_9ACTN|nr:sensor histidine kinase [Geodermatophilus sabuli]MBB3085730.1 anti-sigma regulatory factor (Ser/Thr protein kinase) [Geodermatophilus sabuli]SNX95851.1 Anti-sigma regulatory factor (Ser/Thr protein kinase) [Geodermatophilus sabuli]